MAEDLAQRRARLSRRLKDLKFAGSDPRNRERKKVERAIAKIDRKIRKGRE